ncbi:MAG: Rpn family recombination-promoting nuclease/putative transposase [Candidatus Paracaedibacteraceae bacterium]|nr:Rpn family recombination-promoting nuclease/putative transposase [Candidatus Paracaedibacteraceae bacterium]
MNFKPGRLLDPKADLVFKKIFGNNKDLVKSFLNSILPLADDALIDTLEYLPSEQVPRTPFKKYSIVDVRCCDQKGRIFIVEMQMGWSDSFKSRLQFGTAKAYVEQLEKGDHYELLNPVYGLSLIGEIFDPETEQWYHHYKTVNIQNTDKCIEGLELIFVELPKFKATTHMERKLGILWLRFLNEINKMTEIPDEFANVPEISKAIELTQEASFSKAELAEYDGYWDLISIEKTIKIDAERKGKAKGLAEGKIEGKIEAKTEVAREMLKEGLPLDLIARLTNLSKDTIEEIKKAISN